MDLWQAFGVGYGIAGIFYVWLESTCFEYDFSEASKSQMFLVLLQQANHFLRVGLFWPSYLLEDAIIMRLNAGDDDE